VRPRLIASVPGLDDPSLAPFERFEKFARMIVSVPKTEADAMVHERKGGARVSRIPSGGRKTMSVKNYNYGSDRKQGAKASVESEDGEQHAVGIWGLHVLVVPDGKGWFAQAFEIDYGVQGNTLDEVKARFESGLSATIHHNIDIFGGIESMLHPNQDWYLMKAQNEGQEYDYSCVEMHQVPPKFAKHFKFIHYETVKLAA
jgi:hypothetical protein